MLDLDRVATGPGGGLSLDALQPQGGDSVTAILGSVHVSVRLSDLLLVVGNGEQGGFRLVGGGTSRETGNAVARHTTATPPTPAAGDAQLGPPLSAGGPVLARLDGYGSVSPPVTPTGGCDAQFRAWRDGTAPPQILPLPLPPPSPPPPPAHSDPAPVDDVVDDLDDLWLMLDAADDDSGAAVANARAADDASSGGGSNTGTVVSCDAPPAHPSRQVSAQPAAHQAPRPALDDLPLLLRPIADQLLPPPPGGLDLALPIVALVPDHLMRGGPSAGHPPPSPPTPLRRGRRPRVGYLVMRGDDGTLSLVSSADYHLLRRRKTNSAFYARQRRSKG
jgi:hypothetical protein